MLYRKNKQSNFSQEEINFLNNFKSFNDFYAFSASFRGLYSKVMNFAEDLKESGGMEEAPKDTIVDGKGTDKGDGKGFNKHDLDIRDVEKIAVNNLNSKEWDKNSANTPAAKEMGIKATKNSVQRDQNDKLKEDRVLKMAGLDPSLGSSRYGEEQTPENDMRWDVARLIEANRRMGRQTGKPNTPENVEQWLSDQAAEGNQAAIEILNKEKPENYPLYTQNTQKAPVDLTQYRRMMA